MDKEDNGHFADYFIHISKAAGLTPVGCHSWPGNRYHDLLFSMRVFA
jgi:hypothetical protein